MAAVRAMITVLITARTARPPASNPRASVSIKHIGYQNMYSLHVHVHVYDNINAIYSCLLKGNGLTFDIQ